VELEQAGYTVDISGVNLAVDTTEPISGDTLQDLSDVQMHLSLGKDETGYGIRLSAADSDPYLELQAALAAAAKTNRTEIKVPIYRIVIKPAADTITVRAENWLTDQTIAEVTLKTDTHPTADWAATRTKHNAQLDSLVEVIKQDKAKLAETYGKLLTERGVSLNAMDLVRFHEGPGMATITQLLTSADVSYVQINGFKHNNLRKNSPFIAWGFGQHELAELPGIGSPELPGTLTGVTIQRYNGETRPDWWPGKADTETFTDRHGNIIVVETEATRIADPYPGEPTETYHQTISILAPTNFLPDSGSETEATGWSVDLSRLGLPEMTDLIFTHPERPVATRERLGFTFNIYYEGEDSLVTGVYDGYYDAAVSGVLDMQHAFYGYEVHQQVTHNILIVSTSEKNGHFNPRNSATIALTEGHMDLMNSDYFEVISTGRHETGHALFNHLGLTGNEAINTLHRSLSAEFFRIIAESNWEKNGFGGHPQDRPTELFASFMNGLMVADFEVTMRAKLTPATATEYAQVAKVFREQLTKPLKTQNDRYETIDILQRLAEAETIANAIAAGK
jgi:hypothetical protein